MRSLLVGAILVLLSATPVLAASPSNPTPPLPQPPLAKRVYSQFELQMIQTYRLVDLDKVDSFEYPGASGSAGASGDAGAAAASSGPNGTR